MTPISRTLKVMAYQAVSRRKRPTESQKRQQFLFCKLRLSFLQRLRHKRSLDVAKEHKTRLHSFDLVSVVVFHSFLKENACFNGFKVFALLCASKFVP